MNLNIDNSFDNKDNSKKDKESGDMKTLLLQVKVMQKDFWMRYPVIQMMVLNLKKLI